MPATNDIERIFGAIKELEARVVALEAPLWSDWYGKYQPIDTDTRVAVRLRNGEVLEGEAQWFVWAHHDCPRDIVAFRVIQ